MPKNSFVKQDDLDMHLMPTPATIEETEAVRKARLDYKYALQDYRDLQSRSDWSTLIKTKGSADYANNE